MDTMIIKRVFNKAELPSIPPHYDWIRQIKASEIKSYLPPFLQGEIQASWIHLSSMQLGGDTFDYGWLDEQHFMSYLIDVCGHGVEIRAALLCVAVASMLRERNLPVDFTNPSQVLAALNKEFPMEEHKNLFFTMWYGVYNVRSRKLVYSSGGHPPAILLTGESLSNFHIRELKTPGFVIGGMPNSEYCNHEEEVGHFNKLYLFSDGTYEIPKANGSMLDLHEFIKILAQPSIAEMLDVQRIKQQVQKINGPGPFPDDFSLIQVRF